MKVCDLRRCGQPGRTAVKIVTCVTAESQNQVNGQAGVGLGSRSFMGRVGSGPD